MKILEKLAGNADDRIEDSYCFVLWIGEVLLMRDMESLDEQAEELCRWAAARAGGI